MTLNTSATLWLDANPNATCGFNCYTLRHVAFAEARLLPSEEACLLADDERSVQRVVHDELPCTSG